MTEENTPIESLWRKRETRYDFLSPSQAFERYKQGCEDCENLKKSFQGIELSEIIMVDRHIVGALF